MARYGALTLPSLSCVGAAESSCEKRKTAEWILYMAVAGTRKRGLAGHGKWYDDMWGPKQGKGMLSIGRVEEEKRAWR